MIQINASKRLAVMAADAGDAGKIVLWVQKATGAAYKKVKNTGDDQQVEFKIKAGADTVYLSVMLAAGGKTVTITASTKESRDSMWWGEGRTGRQAILEFKGMAKSWLTKGKGSDEVKEVLTKLVRAKSKVE